MTEDKHFKEQVRARMLASGESYTTARRAVLAARTAALSVPWTYEPLSEPTTSKLEFYVETPDYDVDVHPGTMKDWRETVGEWSLAKPEITAVVKAGPRPGGWFVFPDGAGAANDVLMDAYDLMESSPDAAFDVLERRVGSVPEDLDAWCAMAELLEDLDAALELVLRGVSLGEGALPASYSDAIQWGTLANRPFLRCLSGVAHNAAWLGRTSLAVDACVKQLWLDPHDSCGARFLLHELRLHRSGHPLRTRTG